MKLLVRYAIAVVLLTVVLSSCKNRTPQQAKLIPKTASVVLVLDAQAMQNKLQKGGLSIDSLFENFFRRDKDDEAHRAKVNELRSNAGINWNSQLYFFMVNKPGKTAQESIHVFNIMGSLNDPAKFEAFLKKQDGLKDKEIKKENGYSYLLADDGTLLSWNGQYLMASIYNQNTRPVYDTVTGSFKKPETGNITQNLKTEVNSYYTLKEEESIASVSLFTNLFKEKADGYAFTSSNSYLSMLSMMPLQLPKLEEFIKDNYSASTLNFEDGKIVAKSTSYPNELLSALCKQYPNPAVNLSLIDHFPSQHVNGFLLFSFNPEIVGGLLKQMEVEGMANNFLQKTGLTTEDFYKAIRGDMAVVISDIGLKQPEPQNKTDELSMVRSKPTYKMVINIPVGNQTSFYKLMDQAVQTGVITKQGSGIYKGGGLLSMVGLYLQADGKNLILASDSLTYVQYMAGISKAVIDPELLNRFKDKTGGFYFDIARTISSLSTNDSSANYQQSMKTARETFKDIIVTSGPFNGKSSSAVFEVRLQNEKQNSLVTLTSLLTDVAVDMRAQARKEKALDIFPGGVPAIIHTN